MDGCLKGRITYAAYKSVPNFSQDRILVRLDYPIRPVVRNQPEISIDSFVKYGGHRVAGYFLTPKLPRPFDVVGSKDVLLLARIKDWMKGTFVIPNKIKIGCNIPDSVTCSKGDLLLVGFEAWMKSIPSIKDKIETKYNISDLCKSISIVFMEDDTEIKIKYNVPDLTKLKSFYNPGDTKWALHYYGENWDINSWELARNRIAISRKKISRRNDKGKIVRRGMNEAIRHYIDVMKKFERYSPPMIVSFDEGIEGIVKPIIKDAESRFSLRPSLVLQSQQRCYD